MCWDSNTSWATFLIGTAFNLFNILYFKNATVTVVSVIWEWLLLMQIFEAKAWDNPAPSKKNQDAARGAMIANMVQPIVMGVLLLAITPVSMTNKIIAGVLIIIYSCWVLDGLSKMNTQSLKPGEGCRSLEYGWWKKMKGNIIPYMIVLFGMLILLLRPMKFAYLESGYIAAIWIISMIFYSCGVGSMWCWMAAFGPVLTGIFWKMSH